MNAVEVIHVSKKIGDKEILNNINMILEHGKIYGFFGRNGSGKTMLFRAVCGLIKPTSGEIKINGKTLHRDISFPESVGVLIESPGFWSHYTGFENLKVLASIKQQISAEDIKKSIERVGLDPEDQRTFKKYSLGMKQRLAIAQAIMEKPDLLVLDEPTNALDEEGVELVREILLEEKERGATILIASHNKDDIEILADEKFQIHEGKLIPFKDQRKDIQ
ncbi:putative ABC transporter ATP-binding protein YybJ [Collibacillus ludicampi]|uniref:ABC transporter ATP-binding protein YybJ n=1 Tax=Collibacillus ludicampi TaxID=2771369 RepID=A0AAV4LDB5_9BACL|nr:ATP-binding cassette domain-containing protein [Collibacillus ludicampi]GIM45716.1 putative ABC transporter ATP-binding protein YybJ [Collibacillus ludicampi]